MDDAIRTIDGDGLAIIDHIRPVLGLYYARDLILSHKYWGVRSDFTII